MYIYRTLTPAQQAAVVAERQQRGFPWHGPPHPEETGVYRIVTATCYEHCYILNSPQRLEWFEQELLKTLHELQTPCAAWCVLSNHYHVLVQIPKMKLFMRTLGRLHGRSSFRFNQEDNCQGRKV